MGPRSQRISIRPVAELRWGEAQVKNIVITKERPELLILVERGYGQKKKGSEVVSKPGMVSVGSEPLRRRTQ